MIYTVGYQGMRGPEQLRALANKLGVTKLIDCRSVPRSRKRGFGGDQLAAMFGRTRFVAGGHMLGGRDGGPTEAGFKYLRSIEDGGHVSLLMCAEHAPGDCHRHSTIALPMWRRFNIRVYHVCDEEVILASELERSRVEGDDYEYVPLSEAVQTKLW